MAYQSLYRKYRPQTFGDVVGQSHVVRTLQNALASGRVAHGYLFTGTRGTAKTTVARLLAKALNCQSANHPQPEPCNNCPACQSITSGSSIDVIEMDAASHRGVADIEEVRKAVGYGPMELRYKVFIIDEAHQLSSDAKDAFLKTLEEPPPGVVFILATTEPQSIPITIRSRCQQFDFKRGSLAEIAGRLRYVLDSEGVTYEREALTLVARGAEGSYRDSLSLLEQVLAFAPKHIAALDVNAVLGSLDKDTLAQVVQAVAHRDAPGAFALAGELLDAGKEARTLLRPLSALFGDLMLVSVGGPAVSAELSPDEVASLQAQARFFTPRQMMRAMDILNEAQGETRWNNQHRLLVELAFLKLMSLGDGADAPLQTAPIVFTTASQTAEAHVPVAAKSTTVPAYTPPVPSMQPLPVPQVAPLPTPPQAVPVAATPLPKDTQATDDEPELSPEYFGSDETDEEDDYTPDALDVLEMTDAPEAVAVSDLTEAVSDDEDERDEDHVPVPEPIADDTVGEAVDGAITGGFDPDTDSEAGGAGAAVVAYSVNEAGEIEETELAPGERQEGPGLFDMFGDSEAETEPAPEPIASATPSAPPATKPQPVLDLAAIPVIINAPTVNDSLETDETDFVPPYTDADIPPPSGNDFEEFTPRSMVPIAKAPVVFVADISESEADDFAPSAWVNTVEAAQPMAQAQPKSPVSPPPVSVETIPAPVVEAEPEVTFTEQELYQAWAVFLREAPKFSMKTFILLGGAVPSLGINGVEISFSSRANYEQMNSPKALEFVRKLLARCLEVEKLPLRFVLAGDAPPPPKKVTEKKREQYDALSALDKIAGEPHTPAREHAPHEHAGRETGYGYTPSSAPVPPPLPPVVPRNAPSDSSGIVIRPSSPFAGVAPKFDPLGQPARSVSATRDVRETGATGTSGYTNPYKPKEVERATGNDRYAEALADPFVQDTLSVFGGDLLGIDT